jgi:hypothetical protein
LAAETRRHHRGSSARAALRPAQGFNFGNPDLNGAVGIGSIS